MGEMGVVTSGASAPNPADAESRSQPVLRRGFTLHPRIPGRPSPAAERRIERRGLDPEGVNGPSPASAARTLDSQVRFGA